MLHTLVGMGSTALAAVFYPVTVTQISCKGQRSTTYFKKGMLNLTLGQGRFCGINRNKNEFLKIKIKGGGGGECKYGRWITLDL